MTVKPLYQLLLNSSNAVPNEPTGFGGRQTYSSFTFNFSQSVSLTGKVLSLAGLDMFYSWYSVTQLFGNNSFSYVWNANPPSTYNVVIPDGFYSIVELNAYFEFVMVTNKTYLIDNNGSNVYYLSLDTNPSSYGVQLNIASLPNTLPVGWSIPVGATWTLPATPSTPQFIVNNSNFGDLIGFLGDASSPVSYPPIIQTSNYSAVSTYTPQVSPVNSVIMTIDIGTNPYNKGISPILYTFAPVNTTFGQNIEIKPPQLLWTDIISGSYSTMTITFLDQNLRRLRILDPSLTMSIVIRDKD